MLGIFIMIRQSHEEALLWALEEWSDPKKYDPLKSAIETQIGGDPTITVIHKMCYGWDVVVFAEPVEEIVSLEEYDGVFGPVKSTWVPTNKRVPLVHFEIHEQEQHTEEEKYALKHQPYEVQFRDRKKVQPVVYIWLLERPNIWVGKTNNKQVKINGFDILSICQGFLDAICEFYPKAKKSFQSAYKFFNDNYKPSVYGYYSYSNAEDWVCLKSWKIINKNHLVDCTGAIAYSEAAPERTVKEKPLWYGQNKDALWLLDYKIEHMDLDLMKILFFEKNVVSRSILKAYNGYFLYHFLTRGETLFPELDNTLKTMLYKSPNAYDTIVNYIRLRFKYREKKKLMMNLFKYGTLDFIDRSGCFCQIKDTKNISAIYWLDYPEFFHKIINDLKRKELKWDLDL